MIVKPFLSYAAMCLVGSFVANGFAEDAVPKLTRAEFDKLHNDLTTAKEPWQTMPWHLSILDARAQAAKDNKPIYMLCRAGHPLGCV